jgi:hypothetical protein
MQREAYRRDISASASCIDPVALIGLLDNEYVPRDVSAGDIRIATREATALTSKAPGDANRLIVACDTLKL